MVSTAAQDAAVSSWRGAAPNRKQVAAAFTIGTIGVLVAGLQPVLLGSLQAAGRINAVELGHAATVELLALGFGIAAGEALFEGRPLRTLAVLAGFLYALANLATLGVRGEVLTLVRGLAGLPGGVMIWLMTGMIVRSPQPARWSAIYLGVQTMAQLVIAGALAGWAPGNVLVAPCAMAASGLLGVAAAFALPRRYAPLPRERSIAGLPPLRGWGVLAAALLLNACIVGAWVYLEPLGARAHLPVSVVALATPLSLGCQIVGAVVATVTAGRLPWFWALMGSGILLVAATLGLSTLPGAAMFLVLEGLIGLVWLFILAFLVPFAIEADDTRRTAVLVSAANFVGSALGPLAASALVGEDNVTAVLQLCAAAGAAGMVLIVVLRLTQRRQARPA